MGGIDLHGKIKNTTGTEQSNINVVAILFDGNGQPIGQLWTILMNPIQSDEEIGFELEPMSLPDDITKASIADYKVYAYNKGMADSFCNGCDNPNNTPSGQLHPYYTE